MALNLFSEWNIVQEAKGKYQSSNIIQKKKWSRPPVGWVKINIDAACSTGRNAVGIGCVVRDEHGVFQRACNNYIIGIKTPREEKALSLREAMSWINSWRTTKFIFEMDLKLLVDAFYAI